MSWKADYNVVAPEAGDVLDLVGWVTIDNQSGKTFEDAFVAAVKKAKDRLGELNQL